jgi:ABC-type phosphate/phosphonate transport system substrate-binding protein
MTGHPPVASLPMYDWPELRWAHDRLWAAAAERLNARGIAAPGGLDWDRPAEEVWSDPGLLLSQTCGWPYATRLNAHLRLVGTPVYSVEGCEGPLYSSFIVTRRTQRGDRLRDFAGRRFAFNSLDSLSGYVVPISEMRIEGLDPQAVVWTETGSHRASLRAVAEDRADIASIDAVCWAMAGRFEADAVSRLRVLMRSPLRPGLPFVTAGGASAARAATIRSALVEMLQSEAAGAASAALYIRDIVPLAHAEYAAIAAL